MPKTIRSYLFILLIFTTRGWSDILPDLDKYHRYSKEVYIDNISQYPKYSFVILYTLYFDGYPKLSTIDSSGVVPPSPKWSEIYILALEKSLLDGIDEDELAFELLDLVSDKGYEPFPIITSDNLFIENKYPIKREEFHYKIVSIKDTKVKLKLHRRVIEFQDGLKKIVRVK